MKDKLKAALKSIWVVMSRNVVLKVLSFIFAIMLWSYVVSTNTSITRERTFTGLTGYVSGQATLEIYKLALLTDPSSQLADIAVEVSVPQASYAEITPSHVQVILDVSSVRSAGVQEVPIRATTSMGKVLDVYPSSLFLTFEALDSRSIPVNVDMTGEDTDNYWYNCTRINPQQVTVTGPTSLVQSVSQAIVTSDMADRTSTFTTAHAFRLLDSAGEEVSTAMLNLPVSSISVTTEVYPTKALPISTVTDDVLIGQTAEGYVIEDIIMQPETVTVAGDQSLLDGVESLIIEPFEIDSPSQSFTRRATISGLTDFKYISTEQVYVTVQIAEETVSAWLEDVHLNAIGKHEGLTLSWQKDSIAMHVTGPRSKIEALLEDGVMATVDLSGYGVGSYSVPITIDYANYPNIVFELEADEVQITLDEEVAAE